MHFSHAQRPGIHPARHVHRQLPRRAARRDADRTHAAPPPGATPPPPPVHNGQAYWIKLSAQQDGTFTVTNTRNKFSKTYAAKTGTN